jgi:hypothetical protein
MIDRVILSRVPDPSIGVAVQLKSILPETGDNLAIGPSVVRFYRRNSECPVELGGPFQKLEAHRLKGMRRTSVGTGAGHANAVMGFFSKICGEVPCGLNGC